MVEIGSNNITSPIYMVLVSKRLTKCVTKISVHNKAFAKQLAKYYEYGDSNLAGGIIAGLHGEEGQFITETYFHRK